LQMLRRTSVLTEVVRFASLREKAGSIPASVYEPIFHDPREFPEHEHLNIRLQGYDYVPLENFQGLVHRLCTRFGFNVLDSYAVAAQTEKIVSYKPNSTLVDQEIALSLYDRVVRIGSVPAPRLQLLVNILKAHTPIGVQVTVKSHEKADEDYRYIPDGLLKQRQEELKMLDDPVIRKNLGWE
ncbi:hypothetical protein PENTCL1PPCAC_2082, partial [Pristionchus entomophagus]